MPSKRPPRLTGALCAMLLTLGACANGDADKGGPQTPEVGYVTVAAAAVPITSELGGRTVAFETSEVRPQVTGLIRKRLFTAGSFVRSEEHTSELQSLMRHSYAVFRLKQKK